MEDRWITDTEPEDRFPLWTRGNAADVFPDPVTPLMWTFYCLPGLCKGLRDAYLSFGMLGWSEFTAPDDPVSFGCFGGYVYNPLSAVRLMGARMPGASPDAIDRAYLDDRPEVPPYQPESWHESPERSAKLVETAAWVMSATELSDLDDEKRVAEELRAGRPPLGRLSDAALLARARSVVPYLQQSFETGIIASMGGSLGTGATQQICESIGRPDLSIQLLAGVEVDSAKPSISLWELGRVVKRSTRLTAMFDGGVSGLAERLRADGSDEARQFHHCFESFLASYGSRGPKEWDLNAKVWEIYPEVALAAVDRMRLSPDSQSPQARQQKSIDDRDAAIEEVRRALAGDSEAWAGFEAALRSAQLFMAGRERYKTTCIKMVHEIRMCFVELGRRMTERGVLDHPDQLFMLLSSELDHFRHEPETFGSILRDREHAYRSLYDLEPPFVVNRSAPPLSAWGKRSAGAVVRAVVGEVMRGAAGSGGVASGRAKVVLDPADPGDLEPGDVLVAPQTDPSWIPLFLASAAVVVDVGAAGSHAMIVSRDLGIPCVASVANASQRIPDGALVTVDGNAGTVVVVAIGPS